MANSQQSIFIFATEAEAAPVRAARGDLDIRICGVGVVEAAMAVAKIIEEAHPEAIILCGIAGAYDSTLNVGDVVAVEVEQTATLPKLYQKSYSATLSLPLMAVVSNTVMAVGAEACGAQVENMEGAAVFALCADRGVKCAQIRAISNYTTDSRELWDIPAALEALVNCINGLF